MLVLAPFSKVSLFDYMKNIDNLLSHAHCRLIIHIHAIILAGLPGML